MGIFFSMEFGIMSGPGVLLLAKSSRHELYVLWSRYVYRGLWRFPRFAMINPSMSCQGYCVTAHVQ